MSDDDAPVPPVPEAVPEPETGSASAEPLPPPAEEPAMTAAEVPAEGSPAAAPPAADTTPAAGEDDAEMTLVGRPRQRSPDVAGAEDEAPIWIDRRRLERQSRRDFLLFGAGAVVAASGMVWLLPEGTKQHWLSPERAEALDSLAARFGATGQRRERFLNRVLTFDDDVAEALYSSDRSVRSYRPSDVTALRNNYNGRTPSPEYLPSWRLMISGLAGRREMTLSLDDLLRLPRREQVTRLCCVEGWSAIAWWGGVRFVDLLRQWPPAPGARWASIESAVNLDGAGRPDPYYVSIDLDTARHAQTLLATHQNRLPLEVAHGAPLRLVAPMKLGLKNIKAITAIRYTRDEPRDYWNERGYSKYDGL